MVSGSVWAWPGRRGMGGGATSHGGVEDGWIIGWDGMGWMDGRLCD